MAAADGAVVVVVVVVVEGFAAWAVTASRSPVPRAAAGAVGTSKASARTVMPARRAPSSYRNDHFPHVGSRPADPSPGENGHRAVCTAPHKTAPAVRSGPQAAGRWGQKVPRGGPPTDLDDVAQGRPLPSGMEDAEHAGSVTGASAGPVETTVAGGADRDRGRAGDERSRPGGSTRGPTASAARWRVPATRCTATPGGPRGCRASRTKAGSGSRAWRLSRASCCRGWTSWLGAGRGQVRLRRAGLRGRGDPVVSWHASGGWSERRSGGSAGCPGPFATPGSSSRAS